MNVDLLSMHTHRTIFNPKANALPRVEEIAAIVRHGDAFFVITCSAYTMWYSVDVHVYFKYIMYITRDKDRCRLARMYYVTSCECMYILLKQKINKFLRMMTYHRH